MNPEVIQLAKKLRADAILFYTCEVPHMRMRPLHGGGGTGSFGLTMQEAIRQAALFIRAADEGFEVSWEHEDHEWDCDMPPPKFHMMASVYHPDRREDARRTDPWFYVLAHLGSIALNKEPNHLYGSLGRYYRDPYVLEEEANLLEEAFQEVDEKHDREVTNAASALASRVTFAGVSPEVQP